MPARVRARWLAIRDAVLLAGGMALTAHETLVATEPRPLLLAIACGMMGLPAALLADRRLVRPGSPPPDPATDPTSGSSPEARPDS